MLRIMVMARLDSRHNSASAPSGDAGRSYVIAGKEWPLELARHPRARRISLRIRAAGKAHTLPQIILTVPKRASITDAMKFLQANTVWLARELARHSPAEKMQDGEVIAVLGEPLTFRHSGQLRGLPKRENDIIWLSGLPERFGARAEHFITIQFEQFSQQAADDFAKMLNVSLGQVYAKTMRARWGSCSPDGDIALNWRLALAPREVALYVVAHEVAHRRQMNHSPTFWAEVRRLMPDYVHARDWLKANGHTLYQLQF
jgi:predicted metal-dependent hydrolase